MIKVSTFIQALPEVVWCNITHADLMKKWYFDISDFVLEEGAVFNFTAGDEEHQYHHQCRILEIIPNQLLRHTWVYPEETEGSSVVSWYLEPSQNGTMVTLEHEGTETFANAGENFKTESFLTGWNEIVKNSLKNFTENNP